MARRRVLVLGGGLAGLEVARALRLSLSASELDEIEIGLVAREHAAPLSPFFAQVCAGRMGPGEALLPLSGALPGVKLLRASTISVEPLTRKVQLAGPSVDTGHAPSTLGYDALVAALGAATSFMGVPGADEHAIGVSSLSDVLRLQARVVEALEHADVEESSRRRKSVLTVVIVGDNELACSLAGEIAAMLERLRSVFTRVEPGEGRVVLVCPSGGPLSSWGPTLSARARAELEAQGVEVRASASIERVAGDHVMLSPSPGHDARVETRTVAWCAGVTLPMALFALAPDGGRVPVDETLAVKGVEGAFALGDCAAVPSSSGDGLCPGSSAHVALQAQLVAANVLARLRGTSPARYATAPRLLTAPLGPGAAVGSLKGRALPSGVASLLWAISQRQQLFGIARVLRAGVDAVLDHMVRRESTVPRLASSGPSLQVTPRPAASSLLPPPVMPPRPAPSRPSGSPVLGA